MSGNPWFRMHAEFEDDPKVRVLPEVMQLRLVWLMCEHCKGVTLSERHRTFQWRCTEQELADTKAEFIASGFIDDDWNLLNWNKRQYVSDSSTDRTRRYRERKRTVAERHGNVTVTPPDTDTDTDTDIKATTASIAPAIPASPPFIAFPLLKGKKHVITEQEVKHYQASYPAVDVRQELREVCQWLDANPEKLSHSVKGSKQRIVRWLGREQDKGGAKNNARPDAVLERQKQNIANIEAAARRLEGSDGASGGFLPQPNTASGNSRRIPDGVGSDSAEVWGESLSERSMERSPSLGLLSIAEGYRGRM